MDRGWWRRRAASLAKRRTACGFLEADAAGFAHADYPRYSPDGRWLAFRSAYALILVDRQTGRARRLEAPGGVSLGNTPPVWGSVSAGC
jgi:hypothetical protein